MAIQIPQERAQLRPSRQVRDSSGEPDVQVSPRISGALAQSSNIIAARENEREKQQRAVLKAQMENLATDALTESKARLGTLQGANVLQQSPQIQQELQKRLDSLVNEMPEAYRDSIGSSVAASALTDYRRFSVPFQYKAAKEVQGQTFQVNVKNKTNSAVQLVGDLDRFESEGLSALDAAVEEAAQVRWGDASQSPEARDIVELEKSLARSSTIRQAIEQQAKFGDIRGAQATYERMSASIREDDRTAIEQALVVARRNSNTDIAVQLMTSALTLHPDDPVKQEEFIRAQTGGRGEGDVYREAVSMTNTRNQITRNRKEQEEMAAVSQAFTTVEDYVSKGKSIDAQLLRTVPGPKRQALLNYASKLASGAPIVTDPKLFTELQNMYRNEPQRFARQDFMTYADRLSKADMSRFQQRQDQIINRNQVAENNIMQRTDKTLSDLVRDFSFETGLDSDEDKMILHRISMDIMEELQGVKGITPLEIRQRALKALYNSVEKKSTWFGLGADRYVFKDENAVVETSPVGGVEENIPSGESPDYIHPSYYDAIRAKYLDRGRPDPTNNPAEMSRAIKALKRQGFNLSQEYRGK